MRIVALALLAATAGASLPTPVIAQSRSDEARFQAAQARFDSEWQRFRQEYDRYQAARSNGGSGGYGDRGDNGYAPPPPPPPSGYAPPGYAPDDRYENGFDPSRYYRPGPERALSPDERVYAGNDGRYYCRRSDGTTGLVVGGLAGGALGNVIQGGHSRVLGTLLGGAAGALAGQAIDRNNSQVRCR